MGKKHTCAFLVLCIALFIFCSTEGPQGPAGPAGPGTFYQQNGVLTAPLFDTATAFWRITVDSIKDTCDVGCRLRQTTPGSVWREPEKWFYGSWTVMIWDTLEAYAGYEYKITVISP